MKWRNLFHRPNGVAEIADLKGKLDESAARQGQSARRLSSAVEEISREKRQKEEEELAAYIKRARSAGAQ